MLPISVCMIAKNEDMHIEECLKRLRPCKFEIIVVDTGSVDRTMETAHRYTALTGVTTSAPPEIFPSVRRQMTGF